MEISGVRVDITIGDLEVYRAPRWWVESLRHYPLGRAGMTLPDPNGELHNAIQTGDDITISFGYRNRTPVTWSGTVTMKSRGETKDQLEVRAVDDSAALSKVKIKQAWENESPEAIVAYAVRQAGLKAGRIDSPGIIIPRVSAADISVWQLVMQLKQSCSEGFGLDMTQWALWLGSEGVNWGDLDEPGDVVTVATSGALIDHRPTDWASGMSQVEAFLIPELMHSRRFRLQDDRRGIDAAHRALRVRHEGTPDRCRTFIWYGRENG